MQSNKLDIICFPGTLFDKKPHTNRQRVMSKLASRGHRVVYVEPLKNPFTQLIKALSGLKDQHSWRWFNRLFGIEYREENLLVTSCFKLLSIKNKKMRNLTHWLNHLILKRKIKKIGMENPIIWIYSPDAIDFSIWMKSSLLIYDCVDEYSAQPWYIDSFNDIKLDETVLLNSANLVFTSAEALYKSKSTFNVNTHLLENVADFEHFNKVMNEEMTIPAELSEINGSIIGFIGAIDSYKLDFKVVQRMATENPHWNIILIGPHGEAESASDISDLLNLKNIFFLGPKKYEDLPAYIKRFDVCLIPYQENDYTAGCFPLKFFEYLATGKPVVTKGLPSLKKYSEFNVYSESYEDFISKINHFLFNDNEDEKSKRINLASQNTWDSKVIKMEKLIEKHFSE